jgi:hypothetical protein
MLVRLMSIAISGLVLVAGSAEPATLTASGCESYLLTVSAKYAECRLKAIAIATKTGTAANYTKCDPKLQMAISPTNLAKKCPLALDPTFPTALQDFITGAADGAQVLIAGGAAGQPPIAITCETSSTTTTTTTVIGTSTTTTTTTTQLACTTDTDCLDPADYCSGNVCVVGCRISTDGSVNCGAGLACSPAGHLCLCADCTETNPQLIGPHLCVSGGGTLNDQCIAVACESDTDCAATDYCSGNACVSGCRLSPDNCPSGMTCDAGTHTCTQGPPPPACLTDTDCPAAEYCNGGTCAPGCRPATTVSADTCGDGLECSPADHLCHCSQCFDENPVFNNVPHVCVSGGGTLNDQCIAGCENDLDCLDTADYCNTSTHLCVPGCRPSYTEPNTGQVQADSCGPGLACNAVDHLCQCSNCSETNPQLTGLHACVAGGGTSNDQCIGVDCTTDTDCAAADYCSANACVSGCRLSPDNCPSGTSCDAGTHTCTQGPPPPACLTDTDCPAADYCSGGTCVFGCRISTDGTDNCGAGLACSPADHLCLCSDCTETNPQLIGPHLCVSGGGTLNDQCIAVACETDTDCPSGTSCDAGTHACL